MDIEWSIYFENIADGCWGKTQTHWHNTTASCSRSAVAAGKSTHQGKPKKVENATPEVKAKASFISP